MAARDPTSCFDGNDCDGAVICKTTNAGPTILSYLSNPSTTADDAPAGQTVARGAESGEAGAAAIVDEEPAAAAPQRQSGWGFFEGRFIPHPARCPPQRAHRRRRPHRRAHALLHETRG